MSVNPHINWIGAKITKWKEMKVEVVIYLIFSCTFSLLLFYSNNWNTQSSIPPSKQNNSWSSTMLFNRFIHLMNLINFRNLLIPRLTVLKNRLILWHRFEFSWLLSDDLSILSFSWDSLIILFYSVRSLTFSWKCLLWLMFLPKVSFKG